MIHGRSFVRPRTREALAEMQTRNRANLIDFVERQTALTKQYSPYDTGNNRDSIDWEEIPGTELGFLIYTQSGYGGFLEVGTFRMEGRLYFRQAFRVVLREFQWKVHR